VPMISLDKTFPARESRRDDFEFEYVRPSRAAKAREVLGAKFPQVRGAKRPAPKRKPRRGTISPLGVAGRPSSQAPRGRVREREKISGPTPPKVTMDLTKLGPSPEVERKQAISSALLKSAAFVQPSSISGTLQGLLSGMGIGMEIDTAMQKYREGKRIAAESARANKLAAGPVPRPPMRPNYSYSTEELM